MNGRGRVLLAVLLLGLLLFVWRLGCDGLVDETPPLFAASARAMAETGDWLIPRVNGLPRRCGTRWAPGPPACPRPWPPWG
jgi:4-amino-4-deoxy-L-arabinose transferase-like glycosyltransferase